MAIDMHAHYLPPAVADILRTRKYLPRIEKVADGHELFHRPFGTTDFDPAYVEIEPRIEMLQDLDIEIQLLSLPGSLHRYSRLATNSSYTFLCTRADVPMRSFPC